MTGEIEFLIGDDDVDITIESTSCVPTRVIGLLGIGLDDDFVVSIIL